MSTIKETAAADGRFTILLAALGFIDDQKGTSYVATVDDPNAALTVFAPTDSAFADLAETLSFTGDKTDLGAVTTFLVGLGADTLETVVTYHIAGTKLLSGDIAAAGSVDTLGGETIVADELPTLTDLEPDAINPSLIPGLFDLEVGDSVIHAIDKVLLPFDLETVTAPTIAGIVVDTSGASGFDENNGDFDFLRTALTDTDLVGLFAGEGDFTVFAPTDAAFMGLIQALGYEGDSEREAYDYLKDALTLLNGGSDGGSLLSTVLQYHVAGTSLQASQVIDAGSVTTLVGELTLDGLSLVDADPDVGNPSLVATDLQASNGIVHVIDGVLLPADLPVPDPDGRVDLVIGDNGRDFIRTQGGDDFIDGNGGRDFISGGRGNDVILGGGSKDRLLGNSGDDVINGENGKDTILGGSGDDVIIGGAHNDRLFGGRGSDTFVFNENDGHDRIYDFWFGDNKIDVSAFGITSFEELEDNIHGRFLRTEIDLGSTEITLFGVFEFQLDENDFIFA